MSHTSSTFALEHLLGRLDRVGVAQLLEPADDERLEQLQRDLLGQAALVQLQVGADDDHRPGRVVDALAQQVLAEPALLALDHVGERLERAVRRAQHGPLAAVVVEEGVDGLLEHPLLVADDDLGRVQVDELLEPVVAVDDPAVEVVQVAGGEVAAESSSTSGRRSGGMTGMHSRTIHSGAVVAVAEASTTLSRLVRSLIFCLLEVSTSSWRSCLERLDQVEPVEELADGVGAHVGLEAVADTAPWPCGSLPRSGAGAP